ncbi:unnamed protein product, partial [Didymodactylos carnosus]
EIINDNKENQKTKLLTSGTTTGKHPYPQQQRKTHQTGKYGSVSAVLLNPKRCLAVSHDGFNRTDHDEHRHHQQQRATASDKGARRISLPPAGNTLQQQTTGNKCAVRPSSSASVDTPLNPKRCLAASQGRVTDDNDDGENLFLSTHDHSEIGFVDE